MCIAAGNVSFDNCDCSRDRSDATGFFDPIAASISIARLEITSFTFMLVCVPSLVCQMRSGNWSFQLAGNHFVRSLHDELANSGASFTQILIHQRASLLQHAKRPNISEA